MLKGKLATSASAFTSVYAIELIAGEAGVGAGAKISLDT